MECKACMALGALLTILGALAAQFISKCFAPKNNDKAACAADKDLDAHAKEIGAQLVPGPEGVDPVNQVDEADPILALDGAHLWCNDPIFFLRIYTSKKLFLLHNELFEETPEGYSWVFIQVAIEELERHLAWFRSRPKNNFTPLFGRVLREGEGNPSSRRAAL